MKTTYLHLCDDAQGARRLYWNWQLPCDLLTPALIQHCINSMRYQYSDAGYGGSDIETKIRRLSEDSIWISMSVRVNKGSNELPKAMTKEVLMAHTPLAKGTLEPAPQFSY